jgi:hypothetical protein
VESLLNFPVSLLDKVAKGIASIQDGPNTLSRSVSREAMDSPMASQSSSQGAKKIKSARSTNH